MALKKWENIYCRGPVASMINGMDGLKWITNPNLTMAGKGGAYESGRPDAFVFGFGKVFCVECKYGNGSLYMGDPTNDNSTEGFHFHQRSWHNNVAVPTQTPYFIAAYVYPERNPTRREKSKSCLFLVPVEEWFSLENLLSGRKTIALSPELERIKANKELTLLPRWERFLLSYGGGKFFIPSHHAFHSCIYRSS